MFVQNVHGQGQKNEQIHGTKNFVGLHYHFFLSTLVWPEILSNSHLIELVPAQIFLESSRVFSRLAWAGEENSRESQLSANLDLVWPRLACTCTRVFRFRCLFGYLEKLEKAGM